MTDKQQRLLDAATILAASLICAGIIGLAYYVEGLINQQNPITDDLVVDSSDLTANLPYDTTTPAPEPEEVVPPANARAFIDLQSTVDQWLSTTNRQVGLVVYDLDHQQTAASYQPNSIFYTASIYKLFFAYDGYRQLTNNAIDGSSHLTSTPEKGALSYSECLDLMIRESYNGCADPIRENRSAQTRVYQLIRQLQLTRTSNYGLDSTARDIATLLQLYWEHPDLAPELWQQLADSMLNQPETTYDWRQGLPAGFSDQVRVYNKVGWSYNGQTWNVYNDAAIVEFPDLNRHYVVVVLTRNTTSASIISRLGTALEQAIRNASKS